MLSYWNMIKWEGEEEGGGVSHMIVKEVAEWKIRLCGLQLYQ